MNQADKVVNDEFNRLSGRGFGVLSQTPSAVYGSGVAHMEAPYGRVMLDACNMRRSGYATNRADAIEQAFDYSLAKATQGEWERVGEVAVIRSSRVIRALCRKTDL